jgi:hypothetical protein
MRAWARLLPIATLSLLACLACLADAAVKARASAPCY